MAIGCVTYAVARRSGDIHLLLRRCDGDVEVPLRRWRVVDISRRWSWRRLKVRIRTIGSASIWIDFIGVKGSGISRSVGGGFGLQHVRLLGLRR